MLQFIIETFRILFNNNNVLNRGFSRWIHVNGRNQNGNIQLSVAYLRPLPTLNSH